jgi:hypothetical protein
MPGAKLIANAMCSASLYIFYSHLMIVSALTMDVETVAHWDSVFWNWDSDNGLKCFLIRNVLKYIFFNFKNYF